MKTMERKLFPYLMLLPMVIIFGVFLFVPAINGFLISFTKWDGVNPQEFVGLHNYVKLMGDKTFWKAFSKTMLFTTLSVPGVYVSALGLALLLTRKVKRKRFLSCCVLLANYDFQYYYRFILEVFVRGGFWRN